MCIIMPVRIPLGATRREFLSTGGRLAVGAGLLGGGGYGQAGEPAADRVRFGSTDLFVSRLCQGTAFRETERSPDNPLGQRILARCLDLGVNFFDSSNAYGWGGAERALGRAIRGQARDKLVICTKVHPGTKPDEDGKSRRVPFTREFAARACDASLKRLGLDYVDLYLLHNRDPVTPLEEIADTMDALVKAGKIRYWGLSNHTGAEVRKVADYSSQNGRAPLAGLQHYFNIVGRRAPEQDVPNLEQEMFPLIREYRLGLMAFSPLAAGKIAPGRTAEEGSPLAKVLAVMDDVAGELAVGRAQVAIAWVLTHPEVTCSLAGAEKPEHVEDNVAGSKLTLPPTLLGRLNAVSDAYMKSDASINA